MATIFNHTQRWDDYRMDYPGLAVLTDADYTRAVRILGRPRLADELIGLDGAPHLYRWYLYPKNELGFSQYFHIQVTSDPERPLHDHPWDHQSIILAGGYEEVMVDGVFTRKPGDVVFRLADVAHRLLLLDGVKYAMTLFTAGPKIREWGFWYPEGWVHHARAR